MSGLDRMQFVDTLSRLQVDAAPATDGVMALAIRERQTERIEARWHDLCRDGHCRFEGMVGTDEHPKPANAMTMCGGYHGSRAINLETGAVTWTWRICLRHLAWWRLRQQHLRAQKATGKATRTALPKEYES